MNMLLLLQRYREVYKSRYKFLDVFFIDSNNNNCVTIIAFITSFCVNGSKSNLLFWATLWYVFCK